MKDNVPPDSFSIEWLAGYVDGELDAARAARVEQWLADHPDAAELLRAQEAFGTPEFREAVQIPAPDAEAWAGVRQGIIARLDVATVPGPPASSWVGVLAGLATIAAALLIAFWPTRSVTSTVRDGGPLAKAPEPVVPYEVVTDDEVEIVSMLDRDAPLLVVGYHPMPEAPAWATLNDVVLEWVEPDPQGFWPDVPREGTPSPMILMPQPRGR